MVVPITINIKHIRGHTFQLECDRDADIVGLKVQIWEAQKIAIENQRLVYAGRELQDNLQLGQCNIGDGATIFLVETHINANVSPVNAVALQQQQVVIPNEYIINSIEGINERNEDISVSVQIPNEGSVNHPVYQVLDEEDVSEQRISYVIDLAYWVKCYCTFGLLMSLLGLFGCWLSLIPMLFYLFGMCGCRKLNRCGLIFPLFITALVGYGGSIFVVYSLIVYFNGWLFVPLFITILHICIFCCICKLLCGINRLTNGELAMAKGRIMARRCCC